MASAGLRTVLSQRLVASAGVALLLSAQAAAAQPVIAPQTAPQNIPSYCQRSTLTAVEFMQTIQTIVAHGDLTDIAFIEKKLKTKFTVSYDLQADGTPDRQAVFFKSDQTLGSPIPAQLHIFYAKSKQRETHIIAALGIGGNTSNFIENCLHITAGNFISFFGGDFFGGPGRKFMPEATGTQTKGRSGMNGSKIRLNFVYKFEGNLITGVGILQEP